MRAIMFEFRETVLVAMRGVANERSVVSGGGKAGARGDSDCSYKIRRVG